MNMKKILVHLGLVILLAFTIPAYAAADDNQTAVPAEETVAPATGTGFDPFGTIAGIFGYRQEIRAEKSADANLTLPDQSAREEIHQNWWDSIPVIGDIIGNHQQVRSVQELNRANISENAASRQTIRTNQVNKYEDPGNSSAYQDEINESRIGIHENRQDLATNHQEIKVERNASVQDAAEIRDTHQENAGIRGVNVSHQEVHENRQDVRAARTVPAKSSG
ncbi:MAG: hypothetical protein ABFC71_09520 [Methanoregula sp.]|jgi:hypothetical protein